MDSQLRKVMNTDKPVIVHQGYYVELCENCAWLSWDGKETAFYEERGVWDEYVDAEFALACYLAAKEKAK